MFNKDDKNPKETDTIIGASVKVRGDFQGQGNLVIDGEFEGSIQTSGNLIAGERSVITANIVAADVKIEGKVRGDLKLSGCLEIGSKAEILGDITATCLIVAKGAKLNGNIGMNNEAAAN